MAEAGKVEVVIEAATEGFHAALDAVKGAIEGSAEDIKHALEAIGVAFAALLATSIHLFGEAQRAANGLAVELRNQSGATKDTLESLLAFDDELSRNSRFTHDEIELAQQTLVMHGLQGEALRRATQAMVDLGAKTGDVGVAAKMLGNAFEGSATGLKRYGLIIEEGLPKSMVFDAVLGQIEDRLGGFAAADSGTLAGQITNLNKTLKEMGEHLGQTLEPAVRQMLDYIDDHREGLLTFMDRLGETIVTVLNALRDVAEFFSKHPNLLKGLAIGAGIGMIGGPMTGAAGALGGAAIGGMLGLLGADAYEGATGQKPGPGAGLPTFEPGSARGAASRRAQTAYAYGDGSMGGGKENKEANAFKASWIDAYNNVFGQAKVMTQRIETVMKGFTGALSSGIHGFLNDVLVNGKSVGEALMNIGRSMLQFMLQTISQMAAEWIAKHIIMAAVNNLLGITVNANTGKAALAQVAASKAAALSSIEAAKGIAEAGAMAAYAAIPFVGIEMGLAAAAIEEATISGFEAKALALATGGIIQRPTLAMVGETNQREAVINLESRQGKQALRDAAGTDKGGGGTGDGVHIHLHGQMIEGSADSWERITRNVIIPALERHGRKTKRTTGTVW